MSSGWILEFALVSADGEDLVREYRQYIGGEWIGSAVLGPVARPELTVNGSPLSQIHNAPKSQPPTSVFAQRGISAPMALPLPSGSV